MKKINYQFKITYEIINEVYEIAKKGLCCKGMIDELEALVDEASYRRNRDFHYDLGLILTRYYFSLDLSMYDSTFKAINRYLIQEYKKTLPDDEKILKFENKEMLNKIREAV